MSCSDLADTLVSELQKRGLRVHYSHERFVGVRGFETKDIIHETFMPVKLAREKYKGELHIEANGGLTTAKIVNENGDLVVVGEARCSRKDAYNKAVGREIALGRAIGDMVYDLWDLSKDRRGIGTPYVTSSEAMARQGMKAG